MCYVLYIFYCHSAVKIFVCIGYLSASLQKSFHYFYYPSNVCVFLRVNHHRLNTENCIDYGDCSDYDDCNDRNNCSDYDDNDVIIVMSVMIVMVIIIVLLY